MDALYMNKKSNDTYTVIDYKAAFATLFVLGSPRMLYTSLPKELQDKLDGYRKAEDMTTIMRQEVQRISQEVTELTTTFCTCGPGWSAEDDKRDRCK
jgi:glutathione gamma-glutamylcysteinyltransferase